MCVLGEESKVVRVGEQRLDAGQVKESDGDEDGEEEEGSLRGTGVLIPFARGSEAFANL